MAKRGKKPLPTALHVFNGNPNKRKTQTGEVKPPVADALKRPTGLTQAAGRKWTQMVKLLRQVPGLLTVVDAESLQQYCELWSVQRDALAHCKKHGWETQTARGVAMSPAAHRYFKAVDAMIKLQDRFGMNPSARVSIKADPDAIAATDKKAAYFA